MFGRIAWALLGGSALLQAGWMAGVAETKITPPLGTAMAGFAARHGAAEGIHDELYVRALVITRGETSVALVTADLIGLERDLVERIRSEAGNRIPIPAERIMISATHTHSGPVVEGKYKESFARAAVETLLEAWKSRRPARLGIGAATHRGWVGMNRRHLDSGFSPVDKQIPMLVVRDTHDRIQAVLYNYSCHPACLGPDSLLISEDWPYFTAAKIKSQLGAGVKVLFFQGTEGNVNTGYSAGLSSIGVPIPTRTFAYAQEIGEILAGAILAQIPALGLQDDGVVSARNERIRLEYYLPSSVVEADARVEQARTALRTAEERHSPQSEINAARVEIAFSENARNRLQENLKAGQPAYAAEIQAIRIGNAGFVSFPGEFFVEAGLAVKKDSPLETTFCIGLANDSIGYVPVVEAYPEGGYEISVARFAPGAAERWSAAALELLHELAQTGAHPPNRTPRIQP